MGKRKREVESVRGKWQSDKCIENKREKDWSGFITREGERSGKKNAENRKMVK